MKIRNKAIFEPKPTIITDDPLIVFRMKPKFSLFFYNAFAYNPSSYSKFGGTFFKWIRIFCAKRIFKECGKISTIDTHAYFGNGREVKIGDGSGIGANNHLPNNIIIGNDVMIGPDIYIVSNNHSFDRIDIPMNKQGIKGAEPTVVEDDCWIGARFILTPGRHVMNGSVIAAGPVLTKDIPEYSIAGGNPAKPIR